MYRYLRESRSETVAVPGKVYRYLDDEMKKNLIMKKRSRKSTIQSFSLSTLHNIL
jgi:hypothetical protein